MEVGEPFTVQELNEMMSIACDPQTNKINYENYINTLIVCILMSCLFILTKFNIKIICSCVLQIEIAKNIC
jgi:hypothetical protein